MKRYIIDTDIGDDIDDALAIDLALRSDLNLIAVTTVFRNVVDRARIAKRLISLYGKKIPVYFGYGQTLDGKNESFPLCQQTQEIKKAEYAPDNECSEDAVDVILDNARKYGKDFVLLAIGPLTNVARAIQKDPIAMKNSGGIILMGGDYVNEYAEWNIICDVAAANVVFTSDVDITAFGHEMTSKVKISSLQQDYAFNLDGSEYRRYLAELIRLWHSSVKQDFRVVLHDLLVVRYALQSDYCNFKTDSFYVETKEAKKLGMMVKPENGKKGKLVKYAVDVDENEFIEYFMKKIG